MAYASTAGRLQTEQGAAGCAKVDADGNAPCIRPATHATRSAMGETKRLSGHVEVVDLGNRRAEALVTLRALVERTQHGMITGMMVIIERPTGAYTATDLVMTGCDNAAERLGRLRFLMHELAQMEAAILARATEDDE